MTLIVRITRAGIQPFLQDGAHGVLIHEFLSVMTLVNLPNGGIVRTLHNQRLGQMHDDLGQGLLSHFTELDLPATAVQLLQ